MTDTGGGSPGGNGGLGAGTSVAPVGPDLGSSAPMADHSPMPMDLPIWPGDPAPGPQGGQELTPPPQGHEPAPISEPQNPAPEPHSPAPMPSAPPTVTQSPQRAWRNELSTAEQAPQPMNLPMWQGPAPAPTQTPEPTQNQAPETTQSHTQENTAPPAPAKPPEPGSPEWHRDIQEALDRTAYASHDVEIKRASQQQPTETQAPVESQELGPEWAGWNTWENQEIGRNIYEWHRDHPGEVTYDTFDANDTERWDRATTAAAFALAHAQKTENEQKHTQHSEPQNQPQNSTPNFTPENSPSQAPTPPIPGSPEWHRDVQETLERTEGHSHHQRYMADLQTAQMTARLQQGKYHPPPIAEPTQTATAYTTHGPVPVHTEAPQYNRNHVQHAIDQSWNEAAARQRNPQTGPQSSTTTAEPAQTETRRWWQFGNQPQTPTQTQTHEPFQPYLRPVPRDAKPQTFTPPQAQPTSRPKPIKEPSEFKKLVHNVDTLFGGKWAPVSENDKTSKRERRTIIKDRHGNRITTMDMPVTGQELAYTRARADEKWKTQNAAKVSTPGKVEHKVSWLGAATAKRTTAKIIKPLFPRAAWELNHNAGPRPHGIVNQQEAQQSATSVTQRNIQAEVEQAMSQRYQEQMDSVAANEAYYDLTNYNKWQKTEQRKVIAEAKAQTQEQIQRPTPDDPLNDLMNKPMPNQAQAQSQGSAPQTPNQAQGQGSAPPQPAKQQTTQQPPISPKISKHPPGTVGFIDPRTYDPRLTTHRIGKNQKDCIVKECPHCSVEANKLKGGSGKIGLKERPSTEKDDELGYWIYAPKDRHHSYGGQTRGKLIDPQRGMNIAQSNQQVRL